MAAFPPAPPAMWYLIGCRLVPVWPPAYPRIVIESPHLRLLRLGLAVLFAGCGRNHDPPLAKEAGAGRKLFADYCAACHHAEGLGVQGGGPPLVASPWVAGTEARLIRIVLHGIRGPLTLGEQTYNLEMPGFGPILGDAQISALLSFVHGRFGASTAPITPATVSDVRAATRGRTEYWTVNELLEVR